ncbi:MULTISPECIES: acyl carrier protein [Peptoniphilus]|uniref:Acyl carrier protein n=2 Tax=Peptoniphilus lacrimalis TaxID=33031 RepID=D1VT46_9FIRM|nr:MULTISPECIES: acyl carrier protein [Peptoniphilus]KGF29648.1 acyl carrier protein [Peptoniphilus lacrimalis DNF00528]EFA90280.1 putative acyl carrier protein [Peptoniphilus lacrimalis 315-B]EFK38639.1 putative acyl carrier protein [Peptoniphilus sp. oral taxon 836 str. F0141]MDK7721438.1 acyl carrier protein [Peptoniphilus lacrimalis]MDK7731039.1 acyl carrier protein [Peptoniphilus lacrimalis]
MRDTILKLIADEFNMEVSDLREDMSFQDDLNADSIELVELIMSIEDELDVQVDDEKIEELKTIGDVLEYVEELEQ